MRKSKNAENHTVRETKRSKHSSAEGSFKERMKNDFDFIDEAPDIIFTVNPEGDFLFANKATQKITGYRLSELLKTNIYEIADPEYHDSIKETFHSVLEKKHAQLFEIEIITSNGKRIPLEIHLKSVIDKKGNIAALQGIARDITKRKKHKEELNQIYKRAEDAKTSLKSIIDNVPNVAIQGFNKKGEVVFWNPFAEKIFGITEDQIKGKGLGGLLLSESEEKEFKTILKKTIDENKPSPLMEWAIPAKTGEKKFIFASIFPVSLPDQEPLAIAMSIDITDRKGAEEKIKEMNRQLQGFSEISADILSIEDEGELFERISQAVVDFSDFNRVLISYFTDKPPYREVIGHRGVTPADLKRVKKVKMPREKYLQYFEKGKKIASQSCYIPYYQKNMLDKKALIPGEKTYPDKEGCWNREDNLLVAMKDSNEQIIGIISVDDSKSGLIPTEETVRPLETFANLISEIIQRQKFAKKMRESEEKYRELISNIKIGIFRATPEGDILEANPSAVEMFGYKSWAKFLNLKTPNLYLNPNDNIGFMKEMEENQFVKNKEFLLKRKDGTSFWASITSTAVMNAAGKIIYYDTVVEDITSRKKLEDEIRRLSVTDELTGLFNRRYFNQKLPDEIKTAERWRSALSLIMMDIDDFKQYNDLYLHLEGDEVLKETARSISETIRKDMDWASRFGGDEFIIVLPGIDASEAAIAAERIRKNFQEISFNPKANLTVHKTLSMGVANCYYTEQRSRRHSKSIMAPTNFEKVATDLTILADKALFKAKESGRNKVEVSEKSILLSRTLK